MVTSRGCEFFLVFAYVEIFLDAIEKRTLEPTLVLQPFNLFLVKR